MKFNEKSNGRWNVNKGNKSTLIIMENIPIYVDCSKFM